jgi:NADH-ubiquinone oxidoreductase chain 2
LSFIPLSIKSLNIYSSEASLKYFLTQALASRTLLFSIILFYIFIEFNTKTYFLIFFINLIFSSSIIIKRGMAPFHFWFPNVIEGLNWINNFILMTWQKIAPIVILSFCLNFYFFIIIILFSIFFGAIGGLNQTSLRKLIAFSSINHLGWIIRNIINNENIWKIYFLFYSILTITILIIFNNFKIYNLNQIFSILNINKFQKLFFNIPLLSLGGLPPFLGFFPKWLTIEILLINNFYLITFLIINFTLITLYFYIRISYSSFLLNFNSINFNYSWNLFFHKKNYLITLFIFISFFGLLLINIFFII